MEWKSSMLAEHRAMMLSLSVRSTIRKRKVCAKRYENKKSWFNLPGVLAFVSYDDGHACEILPSFRSGGGKHDACFLFHCTCGSYGIGVTGGIDSL